MQKNRIFKPLEVIFCPTSKCNLRCPHCTVTRSARNLKISASMVFLKDCKANGITTLGFSGGEPFLDEKFLRHIVKKADNLGINYDRIMTNGVWYTSVSELDSIFLQLRRSGFAGEICISIDAFHKQNTKKLIKFIETAYKIFSRNEIVSISYVLGAKDGKTQRKISNIAKKLQGKIYGFGKTSAYIKTKNGFIKMYRIGLSAIGSAGQIKSPWDGKWFKEDYCRGPGNVLYVHSNGDVACCCGYANDEKGLIIGNIYKNSLKSMIKYANSDPFISTIYSKGLSSIRKQIEKKHGKFNKKTSNNCFFCFHILKSYGMSELAKILR